MIKVDIESEELETLNKKAGGTFSLQTGYIHTIGANGLPNRYPEEIRIFPAKDNSGNVVPYKVGHYTIPLSVFKVDNGKIALGFITLDPIKSGNPNK